MYEWLYSYLSTECLTQRHDRDFDDDDDDYYYFMASGLKDYMWLE